MSTQRLPAAERREQLIRVARHVLAQRGFHETSMNDIAEEAGVTKPVLYQHFASKNELHQAVLEDVGRRLEQAVFDSTSTATSPREQVEAGFSAYIDFVQDDFDGFSLLFSRASQADSARSEIAARFEQSMSSGIAALINVDGMADDHRKALAHGVIGLAEGMVRYWRRAGSHLEPEELKRDLTTLAWVGLRGMEAP